MADTEEPVVVRWFTPIKRFQRLIGKSPGGGYYPGGPYTILQFVGAASVFVFGEATVGIWGRFGWLTNNALIVVCAVIALFGLGFVKSGGRNPVAAGFAIAGALSTPSNGKYDGRRVKTPRPTRVQHHINALLIDPQEIVDALAAQTAAAAVKSRPAPAKKAAKVPNTSRPATPAAPAPAPAARAAAMTSVQRMLANIEEPS